MKHKNFVFCIVIVAMFLQLDFFSKIQMDLQMPFITALTQYEDTGTRLMMVFICCMPIWFLFIFISGNVQELLCGRGKLYLLRNMSRARLFWKESGSMIYVAAAFCAAEWVVNGMITGEKMNAFSGENFEIVLPYFFMILDLILIEYLLELVVDSRISQILTMLYLTVSLIVCCTSQNIGSRLVCRIVFFPALGFIFQNEILSGNVCNAQLAAVLILMGIFVSLLTAFYVIFQKKI